MFPVRALAQPRPGQIDLHQIRIAETDLDQPRLFQIGAEEIGIAHIQPFSTTQLDPFQLGIAEQDPLQGPVDARPLLQAVLDIRTLFVGRGIVPEAELPAA